MNDNKIDHKDIKHIEFLINRYIRELKNTKTGIKHFLEHKKRTNVIQALIEKDEQEIKKIIREIEYEERLLKKIKNLVND